MDGFAVRQADLPGKLRVVGESFAGDELPHRLEPGCTVRIFTGAPMPMYADRVVIQEEVALEGDWAIIPAAAGSRHVRARGSDFELGDEVLAAGQLLTPRAMVAAAAADCANAEVWRRPQIVILATGDELHPPGESAVLPGKIPESVSYGVSALAEQWGGEVIATCRLRDDLRSMELAAGEVLQLADLVVVTGGASVGEKDLAKAMFEPHGLELVFSKVAIKPGKPVWLGRAAGRLVLGLPGNPMSAMVTARVLLVPLLAGLCGRSGALKWESVRLAGAVPECGQRETLVRARRTALGALPMMSQYSSAQRALVEADLLLRCRPLDGARRPGEVMDGLAF